MPRVSSTWRSSLLLAAALALLPVDAAARLCWPAVLDGGKRLQRREPMQVNWLPLLFRQHEVCSRSPEHEGEIRVFLTGSSGIYGFPLGPDQTVTGVLNGRRPSARPAVHFYNLGHLFTYQVKDALIVRESLAYEPDLIVHALVLSDFVHRAPVRFPGIGAFLKGNRSALATFAGEQPAGLVEPLARIRDANSAERWPPAVDNWRQMGRFVRMTAEANARVLLRRVRPASGAPPTVFPLPPEDSDYDCEALVEQFRVLAATDAWASQKGYRAIRGMTSIILHTKYGEVARNTVNPEMFDASS